MSTSKPIDIEAIVREVMQKQHEKYLELTRKDKEVFEETRERLARARAARTSAPKP